MSRPASAVIGAASGGVAGYAFGILIWFGSGGVLSSDAEYGSRERAKFARTGAILGAGIGAVWLAIHPLAMPRCPTHVTFLPSPDVDVGAHTHLRRLGVPTT